MSFLTRVKNKYEISAEAKRFSSKESFLSKVSARAANFTWEDLGDDYWYSESQLAGDYTYRGEIQLFDGKYEWKIENADSGRLIDSGEADEVEEAKLEVEQRILHLQQAYQEKKKKKPPFKSESLNELYFEIKDGIASDNDDIAPASSYFEKIRKVKPNTVLIHFTNKPEDILRNGFRGTDLEHIGLTTRYATRKGPYAFGVDITDSHALDSAKHDYGEHAVVFKVKEGLKAHHQTDEYDQVIFDVDDAFDLHSLKNAATLTATELKKAAKKLY